MRRKSVVLIASVVAIALTACEGSPDGSPVDDESQDSSSSTETNDTSPVDDSASSGGTPGGDVPVDPVPSLDPTCSGTASYRVTFDVTWTEANFPSEYPVEGPDIPTYDAAHLSPLIGAAHGGEWAPWRTGEISSDGTEEMAESGNPATLATEVQTAIDAGQAESLIRGSGVGYPPGQDAANFTASETFAWATVSSMLAPSPDWFAGATVHLCGDAGWLSTLTVDAVVHDAGTDDGSGYNYGWQDTQPPGPITPITDELFATNNVVGTFTFVLQ